MSLRRVRRKRPLTTKQAGKYRRVREQIAQELPELVERHHQRSATLEQLNGVLKELKATRERRRLSLADVKALTGMDRASISKLETGQRTNPTVDTLARYAQALGKRLVVSLTDA